MVALAGPCRVSTGIRYSNIITASARARSRVLFRQGEFMAPDNRHRITRSFRIRLSAPPRQRRRCLGYQDVV